MKRDEYIDEALRSGYKMRDLDRMTTYELSKLPAKKTKQAAAYSTYGQQPTYSQRSLYVPQGYTSSYRLSSRSSQSLTPSEEVALKKYFKGK